MGAPRFDQGFTTATRAKDRDYYRSLSNAALAAAAREEGINPEMAIAAVERIAPTRMRGNFHFNTGSLSS